MTITGTTTTCNTPTGVTVVSLAPTSVSYNFDMEPLAVGTQIQYRISPAAGGGGMGTNVLGAGANTNTITALTPGVQYQSRIKHNCGGGLLSNWQYKPFVTASIRQMSAINETTGIYPNPTSGLTTLQYISMGAGSLEVNISDAAGKVITRKTHRVGSGTNNWIYDFSDYVSGVYFIELKSMGSSITKKLVVVD